VTQTAIPPDQLAIRWRHVEHGDRFARGVTNWTQGLGKVRDAVRQELVTRQLVAHLPIASSRELEVLDAGCGQGTQALALARLGHHVIGVDLSEELLDLARQAAGHEPPEVLSRLRFARADLLDLGSEFARRFDVVCCHGVAMYLPSLEGTVEAIVAAARPGGLVSLLTRNQAGLAMRAGMSGDWPGALAAFEARHYANRLGIDQVRADLPSEVQAALVDVGAAVVAWYGVRLFSDHWGTTEPAFDFAGLLAAEEEAGRRDPYRALAALTHTVARTHDTDWQ
jgi:S-adenosylmethionine-dependent methyltransferase